MRILRMLVAAVLALFMIGFGICAGCGALMFISSPGQQGGVVLVLSALGALIAVCCFMGVRKLTRGLTDGNGADKTSVSSSSTEPRE